MKKYVLILFKILFILNVYGIYYSAGTKQNVYQQTRNNQFLYHHSFSDDLTFAGTDRWAVNFNIKNMITFPGSDSLVTLNFNVDAISVYMPVAASNVTIALHDNLVPSSGVAVTQPGTILFSNSASLIPGWNTIYLPSSQTVNNCWIVLDFPDRASNIPVSASWGTGTDSYYFDRFNNVSGVFRNMGDYGYSADLLFHLVGSFSEPILTIDFVEYDIPEYIELSQEFKPTFTLRNNSNLLANDLIVVVEVRNISLLYVLDGTMRIDDPIIQRIPITSEILPGEIFSSDSISYEGITLPNEYAQYQVLLRIDCAMDDIFYIGSSINRSINVFRYEKPPLLEIFTLSNDVLNESIIDYIENDINDDKLDVIFHFPNSIDRFHYLPAYQRGLQYNHQGFQHIYFNGTQSNRVFQDTAFFDKFQEGYNSAKSQKTFITTQGHEIYVDPDTSTYLFLDLYFDNVNTYLLENIRGDFVINTAFVQTISYYERDLKILTQFISNPITPTSLSFLTGQLDILIEQEFPLYNIELMSGNSLNDLEILIWIQRRSTNDIYYHEFYPLTNVVFPEITSKEKPNTQAVRLFPNPIKHDEELSISFINSLEQTNVLVDVFNIRGQKIFSQQVKEQSLSIQSMNLNTSGIYFVRVSWTEGGDKRQKINRLMIIRSN